MVAVSRASSIILGALISYLVMHRCVTCDTREQTRRSIGDVAYAVVIEWTNRKADQDRVVVHVNAYETVELGEWPRQCCIACHWCSKACHRPQTGFEMSSNVLDGSDRAGNNVIEVPWDAERAQAGVWWG